MLDLRKAVHEVFVRQQECKNSPEFIAVKDSIERSKKPLQAELQELVNSSMAEFADIYKKQKIEIEQNPKRQEREQEHEQSKGYYNSRGHGRGWYR
ncbi:MAG: hypothetical protein ACRC9R_01750 [Enterovibrio sp.]